MIAHTRLTLVIALCAAGCFGGRDEAETGASECGDLDGPGGETGDLPTITGFWTTTFGSKSFYDDCNVSDLSESDLDWINGGVMEIKGSPPDNLAADFDEDRFYGLLNDYGGTTFAGVYSLNGFELHVSFGGLLYYNEHQERARIDGAGFMGVDLDEDGSIDCGLRGDFTAQRSGE